MGELLYFITGFIIGTIIYKGFTLLTTNNTLLAEFTKLGIKIAKKCIEITDKDINAFDTRIEYLRYLTDVVYDEFIANLKELGLYNKAKKYFINDEEIHSFIKTILYTHADKLYIPLPAFKDNEDEAIEEIDDDSNLDDNIDIENEEELAKDEIAEMSKDPEIIEETDV